MRRTWGKVAKFERIFLRVSVKNGKHRKDKFGCADDIHFPHTLQMKIRGSSVLPSFCFYELWEVINISVGISDT